MDKTQADERKPLTLDEVTQSAVEKFRSVLERGLRARGMDETMRDIAEEAVPGDNLALLEIVANSGKAGLGLLYFDSETGASDARTILGEAIVEHIRVRLDSERRTFELEQDDDDDDDEEDPAQYINAYGVDERYYDGSGHPEVCRACGADLTRESHAPNCESAPER